MSRIVGGLVVLVALLVLYFVLRSERNVDAEAQFDGVHLCSPGQKQAATVQAGAKASAAAGPATDGAAVGAGALFAQNDATWGNEEYDHGAQQDIGCGKTIAQCGCAMTSLATVMSLYQVASMPSGVQLNPSTLNKRFNESARLTGEGWVSYGFVFGGVVWTTVNELTKGAFESAETAIRFKAWGTGSEEEIKRELRAGRPVVLEVPGHFIAAVGLEGDEIKINDPAYKERRSLSAYAGKVRSSRLFEPSTDLRSMLITVPANLRVQVKDAQGRTVGTLSSDDATTGKTELEGSGSHYEAAWRDPSCTEKAPPEGAGTKTIFIPLPASGRYTVEVFDPKGGDTAVAVHMHDVHGNSRIETREGGDSLSFPVDYDAGTTAQTQPTPTPQPAESRTPANPTETPAPPTTGPAAPTAVPPVQPTATTPAVFLPIFISPLAVEVREIGLGDAVCETRLSWSVTGDINAKVTVLRNDQLLVEKAAGAQTHVDPFTAGTWSYRVHVINAAGLQERDSNTVTISPVCLDKWELTQSNGTPSCSTTLFWHVAGSATGTLTIYHRYLNDGVYTEWAVGFQEPLSANQRSVQIFWNSPQANLYFDRQYAIKINTGGREINSPIISAQGLPCAG